MYTVKPPLFLDYLTGSFWETQFAMQSPAMENKEWQKTESIMRSYKYNVESSNFDPNSIIKIEGYF